MAEEGSGTDPEEGFDLRRERKKTRKQAERKEGIEPRRGAPMETRYEIVAQESFERVSNKTKSEITHIHTKVVKA